ncbi:MAG: hypothetical protein NPIRA02_00580 [Nitrospirales bacterium]|nr:MAG: hypothetical protein NPIRA02_00580 [Nitrospirales bacterium]
MTAINHHESQGSVVNPFGMLLRGLREEAGVSIEAFARKLKISLGYAYRLERQDLGKFRVPGHKLINRIAIVLAKSKTEQENLAKRLLAERLRQIEGHGALGYFLERTGQAPKGHASEILPGGFRERLQKDLNRLPVKQQKRIAEAVGLIDPRGFDPVIHGEVGLVRHQVLALAHALNEPVDEYLMLAGLLPRALSRLIEHEGSSYLFGLLDKMEPDDVEKFIQALSALAEIYAKKKG